MPFPRPRRSAISMRKAATRCSALSTISMMWLRVRSSSRLVRTQSCRATSFSSAASATRGLDCNQVGVGNRLGGKRAHLVLQSEEIASHVEGADLAAAVAQCLVGAHRAVDDLVEKFGRVIFFVNLGVAAKRAREAQGFYRAAQRIRGTRRHDTRLRRLISASPADRSASLNWLPPSPSK